MAGMLFYISSQICFEYFQNPLPVRAFQKILLTIGIFSLRNPPPPPHKHSTTTRHLWRHIFNSWEAEAATGGGGLSGREIVNRLNTWTAGREKEEIPGGEGEGWCRERKKCRDETNVPPPWMPRNLISTAVTTSDRQLFISHIELETHC